jgi:hypothetical protein
MVAMDRDRTRGHKQQQRELPRTEFAVQGPSTDSDFGGQIAADGPREHQIAEAIRRERREKTSLR